MGNKPASLVVNRTCFLSDEAPHSQRTGFLQLSRHLRQLDHRVPDPVWTPAPAVCLCGQAIQVALSCPLYAFESRLTSSENSHHLRVFLSPSSSHSTPHKDAPSKRTRLSRTLSDMASTESDTTDPSSVQSPQKMSFSPCLSESENSVFSPAASQSTADPPNPSPHCPKNSSQEAEEEVLGESYYHSFHSDADRGGRIYSEGDQSACEDGDRKDGDQDAVGEAETGKEESSDSREVVGVNGVGRDAAQDPALCSGAFVNRAETPLIPMVLYLHRVKSLVLALLVQPHFLSDTASVEEVVRTNGSFCSFIFSTLTP